MKDGYILTSWSNQITYIIVYRDQTIRTCKNGILNMHGFCMCFKRLTWTLVILDRYVTIAKLNCIHNSFVPVHSHSLEQLVFELVWLLTVRELWCISPACGRPILQPERLGEDECKDSETVKKFLSAQHAI